MCKIRRMMEKYFGFKPQTDIDADQAVMHGAAIEAAKLSGIYPQLPVGVGQLLNSV